MALSPISALSPLDGRYAGRLAPLRPLMSEQGYMHRRVQVEVAGSSRCPTPASPNSSRSPGARTYLLGLVKNFLRSRCRSHQGHREDHQPRREGGRVLDQVEVRSQPRTAAASEFVHFACTSEDINNTSHALQLKGAREHVLLPALDARDPKLRELAHAYAAVPMLSRTHGQTASPTTVGKEIANVVVRLAGGAREDRRRQAAGQDERRGRQLQRAPGGLARLRLGSLQPQGDREAAGPGELQARTRSRSSRTTTWPSCSTRWRAPTPS
jgi:adenylosuccinate lyase